MTNKEIKEFDKMYSELFPKMVNFAGRLCRNREEAEDITQDAFVKAYAAFSTCDDRRSVDNWLMKIVYNTFLDRKRMKSRRIQECGDCAGLPDSSMDDFADHSQSPEDILIGTVISPELISAIESLDADSRELVRKIYIERQDQLEVSKAYGIRIGALRSRIHRITLKLRQELMAPKQITHN